MPDPTALANSGPWAVVVAMGLALGVAFVRGWIVPRVAYDREVQRANDATASLSDMTTALNEAAAAISEVKTTVVDVKSEIRALREDIRRDRERRGRVAP